MVPDTPPTSRPLLGNTNGINQKYKYITATSQNGNGIDKNKTCLDNDFCNAFILTLQNEPTMEVIKIKISLLVVEVYIIVQGHSSIL